MCSRLLTVREVSGITTLKPETIRLWISQRRLTHIRLGRSIRIPLDAVEALIREGTIPARGEVAALREHMGAFLPQD